MPAARTVTIELDEKLSAFVDQRVASGAFATPAKVIEDALEERLLQDALARASTVTDEALVASLREDVARYDADPDDVIDLDEAFDQIKAELAAEGKR